MRRLSVLAPSILAACVLLGDCQAPATLPAAGELDRVFAPAVQGRWASGMVVGITLDGQSVVRGYGKFADSADPGRVVFEIGSVTKTFSGLLLADAAVRGVVALNDPAAKHVPFQLPEFQGKPIRLVHLAAHTAALPTIPTNFDFKSPRVAKNPYNHYGLKDMIAFFKTCELPHAPGEKASYSNIGMGLLGCALTRAVKARDLDAALREYVTGPLGLSDTGIRLPADAAKRLTGGHTGDLKPAGNWSFQETMAAAGALRSTCNDMLRYLSAQLRPEATPLAKAIRLSQQEHFKAGPHGGYGLGWLIGRGKDGLAYDHAGQTGAYAAYVTFDPARRFGIVVLSDTASPAAIATGLTLLKRMQTGVLEPTPLPHAIRLPAGELQKYVGAYRFEDKVTLTVLREGDRLYLRNADGPKLRFDAASKKRFFLRDVPAGPIIFEFILDPAGRPTGLLADPDGAKTAAKRIR